MTVLLSFLKGSFVVDGARDGKLEQLSFPFYQNRGKETERQKRTKQ